MEAQIVNAVKAAGSRRLVKILAAGAASLLAVAALGRTYPTFFRPRALLPLPGAPPPRASVESDNETAGADSRLAGARSAFEQKDFAAALHLTEIARKKGAGESEVLDLRSAIFKATDYLDKEIETLRLWTQAAPRDPKPWIKLFYIYLDLGWRGDADRASKQAVTLASSSSRSQTARAIFYYRSASPELAIPFIAEARLRDPANPGLADLQESILIKARKFDAAEIEARKTLASTPQNTATELALAHALLGQNKNSDAETVLREIQRHDPTNVEAAYELGSLGETNGNVGEAERQFAAAAKLDPGFNNVLWRLGRIYCKQGHASEGRKLLLTFETMEKNTSDYETAQSRLRARPDDEAIHYQLAKHHLAAEEFPQAIVELRRVLELHPQEAAARSDLLHALNHQGRVTEARELAGPKSGQFNPP